MRLFRRRLSSARPPHGRSERSSALRGLRLAGKVLAGVVVVVVLAAVLVPKTGFVQERLIRLATDAIRKELHADVEIGSVSVRLLGQQASVYDVRLKDQSQRDMVRVGQIWGNLRLLPLLQGRVVLKEFKVSDIDLLVVKPDSGPANYQFLLDANKKDPAAPKQQTQPDLFPAGPGRIPGRQILSGNGRLPWLQIPRHFGEDRGGDHRDAPQM